MTDREALRLINNETRLYSIAARADSKDTNVINMLEAHEIAKKAIEDLSKIKPIVERALRSSDAINSFKAKSIEEIAEILGVVIEEEPEAYENQITLDDILEEG